MHAISTEGKSSLMQTKPFHCSNKQTNNTMDKYRKDYWRKVFDVVEWIVMSEIEYTQRLRKGYNNEGLTVLKGSTDYLERLSATLKIITELRDSWEQFSDE